MSIVGDAWRDGRDEGRREILWLVYVGAACAEAIYDVLADRFYRSPHHDRELRDVYDFAARCAQETSYEAVRTLADMGDQDAAGMLR